MGAETNSDATSIKTIVDCITAQGDEDRKLKSAKKPQDEVKPAIDKLLSLKAEFKTATGMDYTPQNAEKLLAAKPEPIPSASPAASNTDDLDQKIAAQGEKIRNMKSQRASKDQIQPEVNILLDLKAQYKQATGNDWKPKPAKVSSPTVDKSKPAPDNKSTSSNVATSNASASSATADLDAKIAAQGEKVRTLKAQKSSKEDVKPEIDILLDLKAQCKQATGADWKPNAAPAANTNTGGDNKGQVTPSKDENSAK